MSDQAEKDSAWVLQVAPALFTLTEWLLIVSALRVASQAAEAKPLYYLSWALEIATAYHITHVVLKGVYKVITRTFGEMDAFINKISLLWFVIIFTPSVIFIGFYTMKAVDQMVNIFQVIADKVG